MSQRSTTVFWRLLALAPILIMAVLVFVYRTKVPEPSGWRREFGEGLLRLLPEHWDEWTDFRGEPNLFLFRWAVLSIIRRTCLTSEAFAWLPLLMGILVVVVFSTLISRAETKTGALVDSWRSRRALLMSLVGTILLSPTLGATWLIAERFRVLAPILALAVAAFLLTSQLRSRLIDGLAMLVALLATFLDVSGFYLWPALAPLMMARARRLGVPCVGRVAVLLCIGNLAVFIATLGPSGPTAELLATLHRDPEAQIQALAAASFGLPALLFGASNPSPGAGLAILLVIASLLALLWWRRPDSRSGAVPLFVSLALFGILSALRGGSLLGASSSNSDLVRGLCPGVLLLPLVFALALGELAGRRRREVRMILLLSSATAFGMAWDALEAARFRISELEGSRLFSAVADARVTGRTEGDELLPDPPWQATRGSERSGSLQPYSTLELSGIPLSRETGGKAGALSAETATAIQVTLVPRSWALGADFILVTVTSPDGKEMVHRMIRAEPLHQRERFHCELGQGLVVGSVVRAYAFSVRWRRLTPLSGTVNVTESGLKGEAN